MRALLASLLLAMLAVAAFPAAAVNPSEILADPALEARAREVSKGLRCVVCQNQSIDDSNADLARDMRILVRERITAGDSNDEVTAYMVSRYGDFVLLKPPLKTGTYVLWFGPGVIVVLALIGIFFFYRRRAGAASQAPAELLSDDERRRLEALLKENE